MNEASERPRVAIACQGGGSHTAFTAGALRGLLGADAEIVALSGTSGGAICALLAWYGLVQGDREAGARLLQSFWRDVAARSPWDRLANDVSLAAARLIGHVAAPELNPYLYPERLRTACASCWSAMSTSRAFPRCSARRARSCS